MFVLQGAMKTAKYRKRCFDQIEGIVAENKALSAEVDRLRSEVGERVAEMSAQEERHLELARHLADQYRQRTGQSHTSSQLYIATWLTSLTC
jgi:regulator of replication initiation timing